MLSVSGIRSKEIESPNLAAAAHFYTTVWGLDFIETSDDTLYFRGTGPYHHLLAVHRSRGGAAIRRIVFRAAHRDAITALFESVRNQTDLVQELRPLPGPGQCYGFGFRDPEGRNLAVVCDMREGNVTNQPPKGDRPVKITHVNVNCENWQATCAFMCAALGFRLIDETPGLVFLHCDNTDHNSLVLCKGGGPTINHVAFEMPNLDAVMRGPGRMRDNGNPIEWGVGRHGAGNNVFAYFGGHDDLPLEYTAEVLQIDSNYIPRGPDYWQFPAGRSDQWGITAPPSPRLTRIQQTFRFSGTYKI